MNIVMKTMEIFVVDWNATKEIWQPCEIDSFWIKTEWKLQGKGNSENN